MPSAPRRGLTQFRAWLINEGLSESTAESYVKQIRRAFAHVTEEPTEEAVKAYDATLSVKVRENFRAAWRRLARFVVPLGGSLPAPPKRKRRLVTPLKPP